MLREDRLDILEDLVQESNAEVKYYYTARRRDDQLKSKHNKEKINIRKDLGFDSNNARYGGVFSDISVSTSEERRRHDGLAKRWMDTDKAFLKEYDRISEKSKREAKKVGETFNLDNYK